MDLQALNEYIHIKPLKKGVIASSAENEYEVVTRTKSSTDSSDLYIFKEGDIIIAENHSVVKVMIDNSEQYFIKEENIIARIYKFEESY